MRKRPVTAVPRTATAMAPPSSATSSWPTRLASRRSRWAFSRSAYASVDNRARGGDARSTTNAGLRDFLLERLITLFCGGGFESPVYPCRRWSRDARGVGALRSEARMTQHSETAEREIRGLIEAWAQAA